MNIYIEDIVTELQKERPIFHSEADCQHSIAWQIHMHHPSAAVRLVDKGTVEQREHVEILVTDGKTRCAID